MSLQLSQEELTMLLCDAKIVEFPLIDNSFNEGDVGNAFERIVPVTRSLRKIQKRQC